MAGVVGGDCSNDTGCSDQKRRPPCRPRRQLEYVVGASGDDECWRCPACYAHYEDPVVLSCGASARSHHHIHCIDVPLQETQLLPSRVLRRQAARLQCHCPNRGLGCDAVVGVLDVEHHLGAECEWREEACDQCHQQVRRAEMARHKDTTCARKPMACGYADVGCPTSCPQCDLAAHERDGMAAHMGLLRQCLAGTSLELAQTRHELTQTKAVLTRCQEQLALTQEQTQAELTRCHDELAQCRAELAQSKERTQAELAAVRSQIDQLFIPPPAPEGLAARWDKATKEIALDWRPVPAADPSSSRLIVVYTGPECRCRYRLPPGAAYQTVARFVVVAMRGLAESGPSAPATCTRPVVVFRYDHDMDERGLFYYIGTQGRTQPWQNPAEAGWVTVTRSSEGGTGSASEALGRQPCTSLTENQPNAWWQVDLGAGRLFMPTRYTLRHSNLRVYSEFRLQSWRLEGSVDGGASWRTLDKHTNDRRAIPNRADAMSTFAVAPKRAFPARHFRVLMTGPSPNDLHYLMLSGLEMYGSLRDAS
ncbi:putative E3 ubiquitin-protein ligase HECTD1 [Paratrimastix pyriformis]|uniref:E3 ubiquitin-protein ligase HECTD1 n=1 Tax=Paratrimastix pyriformis TaxID=342808 RepID=A0ABQ8UPN1_9EUKA|nr:putative E3 ubiquitin-protein ligase HECTD1 [Paratrimastix pyriformis]